MNGLGGQRQGLRRASFIRRRLGLLDAFGNIVNPAVLIVMRPIEITSWLMG